MAEQVDYKALVNYGDILAAVRSIHGRNVNIIDYDADLATKSVQGFASLMLRISVRICNTDNDEETTVKLILKRLPVLEMALNMLEEMGIFKREMVYFTKALPILNKVAKVPIVKPYVVHNGGIIMEDLCEQGFKTLANNVQEVFQLELVTLSHLRLAARKLAELHAASLDKDWFKIIGGNYLRTDMMLVKNEAFSKMIEQASKFLLIVISELYPEKKDKYNKFFELQNFYKMVGEYVFKDESKLNVLLHGDCWLNNMMFKHDPVTNEPTDLTFIDLQVFRYAPPSRDLLYFMYVCLTKKFRQLHEKEIIRTYVEAFNTYACRNPDLLTFDSFYEEFDSSRLFGLLMGFLLRPNFLMTDLLPKEGEHLTEEFYKKMMEQDPIDICREQFKSNILYRTVFTDFADDFIYELDKREAINVLMASC